MRMFPAPSIAIGVELLEVGQLLQGLLHYQGGKTGTSVYAAVTHIIALSNDRFTGRWNASRFFAHVEAIAVNERLTAGRDFSCDAPTCWISGPPKTTACSYFHSVLPRTALSFLHTTLIEGERTNAISSCISACPKIEVVAR